MAAPIQDDLEYRLDVLAPNVDEVVRHAGGWLFDQARAGWKVTVLLIDDDRDLLPLHMLGLTPLDLRWSLGAVQRRPRPRGLALPAAMYGLNRWVRVAVKDGLASGSTDITLWGDPPPAELQRRFDAQDYRPSTVARAFKGHAMGGTVGPETEVLWTGRGTRSHSRPVTPRDVVNDDTAAS